jgi:hypothetical protein
MVCQHTVVITTAITLSLSRARSLPLIYWEGGGVCGGVCVRVIVVAYYGLWRNQWWASYKMRIAQLCDSYFRRRRRRRVVGQHHQHNNNNDNNNKMGRCAPAYIYIYIYAHAYFDRPSLTAASQQEAHTPNPPPRTPCVCVMGFGARAPRLLFGPRPFCAGLRDI